MSQKIKSKKVSPRKHPCKPRGVPSKGLRRGARRIPQSEVQKVLLSKGQMDSIEEIYPKISWGKAYSRIQYLILSEEESAA